MSENNEHEPETPPTAPRKGMDGAAVIGGISLLLLVLLVVMNSNC